MVESEALKFLASAAGGAILGGVFGIGNKLIDMYVERGKERHELALRKADLQQMRVEYEGRAAVMTVEPQQSDSALNASYRHDLEGGGKKAAAFRGVVRPALTAILTVAAIVMNAYIILLMHQSWGGLNSQQQFGIIWSAIDWVGFQASTVVSWWFGARGAAVHRGISA